MPKGSKPIGHKQVTQLCMRCDKPLSKRKASRFCPRCVRKLRA